MGSVPYFRVVSWPTFMTSISTKTRNHRKILLMIIMRLCKTTVVHFFSGNSGEFGIVYKGYIIKRSEQIIVAVKTLKGSQRVAISTHSKSCFSACVCRILRSFCC